MEEAVVKQGGIYLQLQQTFGKKWKKFWGVLYRESSCSTARLELLEGSGPAEKPRKAEGSKRLIRLSDCVHVAEAGGDATCPKDTVPFLLETTDRRFLLAADGTEVADWIQRLCELAFPRSREEQAAGRDGPLSSLGTDGVISMEENSSGSSRGNAGLEPGSFEVTVRVTQSSQRCRLRGRCILRAGEEALELRHLQTSEILYSWPYRFLRRFGRDKVTFSFEAGRRCASGEGNFEFDTRQGNEIFQAIESAINVHRDRGAEELRRGGGPGDEAPRPLGHARMPSWAQGHEEPGAEYSYAEPCDSLHRGKPPVPEKSWKQDAPGKGEAEYAVPFDTIAKAFLSRQFGSLGCAPEGGSDPLYNSAREAGGGPQQPPPRPTAAKPYHIYDEPEGLSTLPVYDEPEEVKGEAWRLQAAPEEPPGHDIPYNPQRDDYAVPKRPVPLWQPFLHQGKEWLGDTEYDNVALKVPKK
ncbi:DOK2 protein, partial [Calyptomena viridis]|nr:DOK2 protein [Calyptomena viridis]